MRDMGSVQFGKALVGQLSWEHSLKPFASTPSKFGQNMTLRATEQRFWPLFLEKEEYY
jgi:hypothetical protein